jgi:hypothetical protein
MSKWKPPPPVLLSMHCAGPFSEPTPTTCDKSMSLLLPFTHEKLVSAAKHAGFFVTGVTPPGVNPPECAVLCRDCAYALVPALAQATEQAWAGGKGAGKDKGS